MAQDGELLGAGIDLVELTRVRNIGNLGRFAEYFLNPHEIDDFKKSRDAYRFVASRFAAKEAVIKAFPGILTPQEFQIMKIGKKPVVQFLSSRAKKYKAFVSVTHSPHYVVGYAAVMKMEQL